MSSPRRASAHPPAEEPDRGHLIGALLRLSHRAISEEILRGMAAAGYDDLEAAHTAPFRPLWDSPRGVRATELAAAARITKQSMGALIDHLEARGYVERIDDPADGRAKRVRLTRRGRDCGRLMRSLVRTVEADWAARVGFERLAALKDTLRDLLASLERDGR